MRPDLQICRFVLVGQSLRSARNWRTARSKLATVAAFSAEINRSARPAVEADGSGDGDAVAW